jgi:hypothetical protein
MNTKFKLLVGALALVVMLGLNSMHALDSYGLKGGKLYLKVFATSSSSSSSSTTNTSSTSSNPSLKIKYCRPNIKCQSTLTYKADFWGCITIAGVKKCIYGMYASVEFPYIGEKENCTGGDEWEDCDACQDQCVFEKFI